MLTGMKEWREQHPHATLRKIEEAMEERLVRLRAGMVEELVQMSPQAEGNQTAPESHPTCERCGAVLVSRGKQIEIERSYGTCPQCGQGLFPPG